MAFSTKLPQKPSGKPAPPERPASQVATRRGQAAAFAVGLVGATGLSLASLTGGRKPDPYRNAGIVNFPADLGNIDHWIQFTAKETKGVASGVIEKFLGEDGRIGSEVNGATIRLPLPANLSADYNPSYSDESLGVAGGALKAGDRAIYGNNDIPGMAAAGGALAGLAGAAVKGKVDALINVAETASGGSGFGAAALKVAGGIAQNPHKIVLFTGVDFREHQFSWKLSPRNREESDLIRYIVNMFTYYAHPEYVSGGLFFKYPEFFEISFRHPEYLFQFQPCVCKDVRVNYHGQGFPAYIRNSDGSGPPAPAEVELSLTFRETEIITKDFLNKERIPTIQNNGQRSQMPAVDALGNPLGNGLDVNGQPMY